MVLRNRGIGLRMVGHDLCRLLGVCSCVVSLHGRDVVHRGTHSSETALSFPGLDALSLLLSSMLYAMLCGLQGQLLLVLQHFAVMDLVQGVREATQLESMASGDALSGLSHICGLCPLLLLIDLFDLVVVFVLLHEDSVLMPLQPAELTDQSEFGVLLSPDCFFQDLLHRLLLMHCNALLALLLYGPSEERHLVELVQILHRSCVNARQGGSGGSRLR